MIPSVNPLAYTEELGDRYTPLPWRTYSELAQAIRLGDYQTVARLVKQGYPVQYPEEMGGITPLAEAVYHAAIDADLPPPSSMLVIRALMRGGAFPEETADEVYRREFARAVNKRACNVVALYVNGYRRLHTMRCLDGGPGRGPPRVT